MQKYRIGVRLELFDLCVCCGEKHIIDEINLASVFTSLFKNKFKLQQDIMTDVLQSHLA